MYHSQSLVNLESIHLTPNLTINLRLACESTVNCIYILELLVFKLREIPQFESFHNQRTALREYCLLRNYQIYVQREANAFDS